MSRAAQESPYLIRFTRRQSVLRVQVKGPSTLENTVAYWTAILAEVGRAPVAAILLIDQLLGDPLTEAQWRSLVAAMAGKGLEDVRIAHVKPHGLQKIEYCQLYAREAGFEAHVFDDEYAAELWLRYGER